MMYYKQCRLRKDNKDGSYSEQVSYIPEKFCVKNKILKLKDGTKWDNGWVVTFVSKEKVDESKLPDYWSEIKGHRRATGDSNRK